MVQEKTCEAEAEVERRIGKREILTSLFKRSIRSFNLNDLNNIKSMGKSGSERDKISFARDCQEIEEETDRARKARIDELSLHQERNPASVSQLMTQIRESQNKENSLSDARVYHDPENRKQLWSNPRSRSNLHLSESKNPAALRFWIAA